MNNLDQIKAIIEPLLNQHDFKLFSISWSKFQHMKTLEILVYHDDKAVDLDGIAQVSELLSSAIDESNLVEEEYLLDIGSAGAERELELDQLDESLNKYVFVKFRNPLQGADSVYGDLVEINQDSITIEYRVKHAKKKIELDKENVAKIRLAVKV
ncbi:MAG: ribosome maturation factor RimP [Erysipelothrix sp.]|nr:ribosome maturation factor RimP [Erysipelothrix sp.]